MEQFKQNKETVLSCIKENGYNPEVIRQHKRMYQPLSSFLFSNGRANGKDAYEKCQQPDVEGLCIKHPSMTRNYLEKYIPQDHDSGKTVQSYKNGLTVFRRYVCDEKNLSMGRFTFDDCMFEFVLDYRNWLLESQHRAPSKVNHRLAVIIS